MENKLQELTKKLYDEGLSKGRHEAETLLTDARKKAADIVAEAQAEADRIKKKSDAEAQELLKNTMTEITLAGKQLVETIKSSVQDMIVAAAVDAPVKNASLDQKFVEQMLIAVAKNWNGASTDKVSLSAMLPKDMEATLGASLAECVKGSLGAGMDIVFSDKVKSGFKVGPKNGGYYISFTDDGFRELLAEYLRPQVGEMLYGKKN